MAINTFQVGKIMIGGSSLTQFSNAGLTVQVTAQDTTPAGTSWRTQAVVGKQATLTFNCEHNNADTVMAAMRSAVIGTGTALVTTIRMYVDGSHYFHCTQGLVSGFNPTKSRGAIDQLAVTIEMNNSLLYT